MFKIVTDRTFRAKVEFKMPNEKGTIDKENFTGIFKMLTVTEALKIGEVQNATDFARHILIGFEEINGPDDKPMEYSEENRDRLLDLAVVATAVCDAYRKAVESGNAARKN